MIVGFGYEDHLVGGPGAEDFQASTAGAAHEAGGGGQQAVAQGFGLSAGQVACAEPESRECWLTCCFAGRYRSGTLGDRVSAALLSDHGLSVPVVGGPGPQRVGGGCRAAGVAPRGRDIAPLGGPAAALMAVASGSGRVCPSVTAPAALCTDWPYRPRCWPGTGAGGAIRTGLAARRWISRSAS